MAPSRVPSAASDLDLDTLTPEQAWQLWKPVSDEYIRRITAGEDATIDAVAAELGVPRGVGAIAALADEEQEAEAREWIEALMGDTLP